MTKPMWQSGKSQTMSDQSGRGVFITFEGGEGAGKTSQIRLLTQKLEEIGLSVVTTREPGGSPGGEAIRHVLLSGAAEIFGSEMEAILFSASRSDHIDLVIEPALKAGKVVISDRFFDSTRVYQGVSGKVDMAFIKLLEQIACAGTIPDLTIIIDLDPKEGMARARKRRGEKVEPDRFEKDDLMEQESRRQGFLQIAKEEPERCVVVSGKGTEKQVHTRIWRAIKDRLGGLIVARGLGCGMESEKKTASKSKSTAAKRPLAKQTKRGQEKVGVGNE